MVKLKFWLFCIFSIGARNRSQSGIFLQCCSAHSIEVSRSASKSHMMVVFQSVEFSDGVETLLFAGENVALNFNR